MEGLVEKINETVFVSKSGKVGCAYFASERTWLTVTVALYRMRVPRGVRGPPVPGQAVGPQVRPWLAVCSESQWE